MARITKDPLLGVAQVILALGVVLLIFVAAMMLIGLGAALTVARDELIAELAAAGAPGSAYWALVAILVLFGAAMVAGVRFLLELGNIVKSVDGGDPFEPANADRLQRMGWLATAVLAITVALGSITAWVERVSGEAARDMPLDADFGFGGGGVLLILVLFILARVFRHGAAMREELEGTV